MDIIQLNSFPTPTGMAIQRLHDLDDILRAVSPTDRKFTILGLGFAKWWGSDARALAQEFRRLGHSVIDLDEEDYLPWRPQGFGSKAVRRLSALVSINDYNQAILNQAARSSYDFILCFKGRSLKPSTLRVLQKIGKPVYNFYPDVSFEDHGSNISASLRYYDCVFTTKTYHGEKEQLKFGIKKLIHVRHGFDPEVHRPVTASRETFEHYASDVSFVGCWSPEKEARLSYLMRELPQVDLKVYGMGWNYSSPGFRARMDGNLKPGVFGDELSLVYCASKVNLGLLSRSKNEVLQDQTTARTFQIPATRSFMLHEDTPEVRTYFKDDEEIMLFKSDEEMCKKIVAALDYPSLRERIKSNGHERCISAPYDYAHAVSQIVGYFVRQSN